MVRANSPAVCTTIKSRPRKARRSLSGTSLDVKGSVVMEKVWIFEGMNENENGLTEEQLSEEDTGKDDWCEKHCWFLYTNLISVQQCAKCSKRILTKRAAYKCTECKRLCHLKCAIKEEVQPKSNTNLKISSTKSAMDFQNFVKSDDIQTCRYTRKTSSHGRRTRQQKVQEMSNTNNSIEEMEIQEEALIQEQRHPSHQDIDLSKLSELHSTTGSSQSQTKQKLHNMKQGFVKRCRSIKNKVKTLKEKVHVGENHKSSDDQTLPSSTSTTSSSSKNTEDQVSEQQKAWVRSPVRTRLREKQLEFRRESVRANSRVRRNNSARHRIKKPQSDGQTQNQGTFESLDMTVHPDLVFIKDRMEVIEKRVLELETAIPQEIHEWHRLKKQFYTHVDYVGTSRKSRLADNQDRDPVDETHPKHIEAMRGVPITQSSSSGTTSDEVYLVPDHPSSSFHDDIDGGGVIPSHGGVIPSRTGGDKLSSTGHISRRKGDVMYSPVTSLRDDSLPSGIPNKFRLSMHENSQQGTYNEHQTSTPVTNREISFRSASKQYETKHTVLHTNVTHVNMDHSYSEPNHNSTSEIKLQQRTSIEMEPSDKVLSPEQVAVKSFLDKRKRSSIGGLSNDSRQSLEGRHSPSNFMSPTRTANRSPYNLRSRSSLDRMGKDFEESPKIRVNQTSFYASPPVASSTFRENGFHNGMLNMSPESIEHKDGYDDMKEYSDDEDKLRFGTFDKNASSASNLSYTFRNDSQMIQTNAEEDLPGYIRNYIPNIATDEYADEMPEPLGEINYTGNDRFASIYETDGAPSRTSAHVTFATHDNMSTPMTTTTDDALSLTNVTAFTGDLANSFADSGHGMSKSRWVNKDVIMFERDDRGNPIRPKILLSRDKIDERGDSRKPPIPKKQYSSHSEIDYLREAEKKLDMFKARRSGEFSEIRHSSDNMHSQPDFNSTDKYLDGLKVHEHIAEAEFVPETVSKLQMPPDYQSLEENGPTHNSPSPGHRQIPYNLRHGDLKTKARSPSPRKGSDLRYNSSREPSPTNSERSRSSSPCKSRRFRRSSNATNQSDRGSYTSLKLNAGQSPKHNIDSTTEFEEIERRLRDESHQQRRSRSLTNLQNQSLLASGYGRQKSLSCTNSVDGETKSIINDSARYHFLNDKGMIKISSPSLKIMNGSRRKYEPECNHIDEESSDMVQSGSESNLSGIIVDNNFHINGTSRNTSEVDSRQARSDVTQTDMDSETCEMKYYRDQEREMFEEYLKTADETQEDWDNVLSWMNNEHGDNSNAEVERELEMLMEQEHAEMYQPETRTAGSSQSPVMESVYYSFIGQSEELRGVLSPGNSSVQRSLSYQMEESFQVGPGLMYVILNGSVQDLQNYLNSDRTISETEIKEALQWALDQHARNVAVLLLEDICKLIRGAEDETCVDVFPAYLEQDHWQPVIVILTKQNYQGEWDLFMGLPVYRRRYDLVSNEAKMVVNSDYVKANPLTKDEFKTVRRAIRVAELNKHHCKLTVVNGCPCRSRKGGKLLERGLCIVVHCVIKGFIPFNEEPFPREIQGIPVDVREGYFLSGVATPTVVQEKREMLQAVLTDSETETESHAVNDSFDSKCQTGSEGDRMSRSSSIGSLKHAHSGKSAITYKPKVYDDSNAREVNLNEINEELSDSKGDNLPAEEIIDKASCLEGDKVQHAKKDSLLMGSGITTLSVDGVGPSSIPGHGTVGGFVPLLDGDIGFITCAHVTGNCKDHSAIKFQICNSSSTGGTEDRHSHSSKICGEVVKSVLVPGSNDVSEGEPVNDSDTGVDAALVKVTNYTHAPGFVDINQQQLQQAGYDDLNFSNGRIISLSEIRDDKLTGDVIKIGATTGLTRGKLYTDGLYVRTTQHSSKETESLPYEFHNQLEVSSIDDELKFFDHGDSGCLVFMRAEDTELRCLGLAVGCTSYDTCVVTPISAVLNKLNLPQHFVKCQNCY